MMPFAGGIADTANGTLVLSLAAAFLYAFMANQPRSWRRMAVKTASVALLGVLAYVAGGPRLLMLALMASACGDAALAAGRERWFLPGLAAFLIAHLFYVALFVAGGADPAIMIAEPLRAVWAALILLAAGALLIRLLAAIPGNMRGPATAYALAIAAMGTSSLALPGYAVASGATLFIASDAILAVRKFLLAENSDHAAWTGYAVWILYYAAQLAITLAIVT